MKDTSHPLYKILPPEQISFKHEDLLNYGQDWSGVLTPNPSCVVFPKSTAEVSRVLKFCNDNGLAVVPSGGRTGLSGGACATQGEVVLSLEKMNRMGEVDATSFTLHVECGAITQAVHEKCAPHGLTWPVDFASKGSSQVGGNIATNAGGVRVLKYGNTRNWVLGITAVKMSGEILTLNGELEKNNTGLDLRQLMIGSEGILAVITEATLKLCKKPESTMVGLFAVENFAAVVKLFSKARNAGFSLSAFETFDSACYASVIEKLHLTAPIKPSTDSGAYVLMEFELQTNERELVENWLGEIFEAGDVLDGAIAQNDLEGHAFWKIREGIAESIMVSAKVYQQDVSVPIRDLSAFFSSIKERYEKTYPHFEVFIFGHIGDGNLHIFVRKPAAMSLEEFQDQCARSDRDLFEFVAKFKGSVSAEHGIGVLKKKAISYSRAAEEMHLMRAIKASFDPKNLLNPGKVV